MDPSSRSDLSALMDGELAAEPTRFLLRRLKHDPDLAVTWSRWHLIRACLQSDTRGVPEHALGDGFAARVAAAIEGESTPPRRQRHWARYVGGGALAAGVAVAALMLNVPGPRMDAPAAVAPSRSAAQPAATALADAAPVANTATPPWLLARQPTALSVQPASADVVYGTGLLQPEYLRRATFARDGSSAYPATADAPYSIVWMPVASPPASSAHR